MEYFIWIVATVVVYPVFLFVAYTLSKIFFVKEDELEEFEAKQKLLRIKRERHGHHRKDLAHV